MIGEQKNFFLAVVLSGLVLFTWQLYFAPQTPSNSQSIKPNDTNDSEGINSKSKDGESVLDQASKAIRSKLGTNEGESPVAVHYTEPVSISNGETTFKISPQLSTLEVVSSIAQKTQAQVSGEGDLFKVSVLVNNKFEQLDLRFTQKDNGIVLGEDLEKGIVVQLSLFDKYKLSVKILSDQPQKFKFEMVSKPKSGEGEAYRNFDIYTDDFDQIKVGDKDQTDASLKWVGVDFDYHLMAMVLGEKRPVLLETSESGTLSFVTASMSQELNYYLILTKKDYDQLTSLGDGLKASLNFGLFGVISVPMLKVLKFFYQVIPNYGVAIILLTLIVRLLTFPLQFKSYKSMKKMQDVQPELNKIKEKFKDDPQKLQKETMELFRRAGANPLSGCLPMLLQLPIFFAFYRMLYSSVELVDAPFFGWIVDLSIKDPYYVLPVLMGIAMFGQQKLMPTTSADPTQQKIMLFMPLIFAVLMKDLPAGLNLYIFVSTLFGIVQQKLTYRVIN